MTSRKPVALHSVHSVMCRLVAALNKNKVFKFVSSVRLAVPLMLVIASVIAAGTIYESLYNTEVARIRVYRTWWFELIMIVLWVNIFTAALSRYPFKKHQTGFVITHIGLLTLLIGGQLTGSYGIDGSLRVEEGKSSHTVMLDRLVLKALPEAAGASALSYPVPRSLSALSGEELGLSELRDRTGLIPESFLPFVAEEQGYDAAKAGDVKAHAGTAVSFTMQSAFFNFSESLHSVDRPEAQMGPAHFRVVAPESTRGANHKKTTLAHGRSDGGGEAHAETPRLIVRDAASGEVLETITVGALSKGATVKGVRIALTRVYKHAAVENNKLVDRGGVPVNPALDLKLSNAGAEVREVAFARFPTFAINPQGAFGLRFEYRLPGSEAAAPPEAAAPAHAGPMGNTIEFHLQNDPTHLKIVLVKAGATVLSKEVAVGETLVTPWMGIRITVTAIVPGGVPVTRVLPVELKQRSPLPPSAIRLRSDASGQSVWLVEGEAQTVTTSRGPIEVYYGRDSVNLPFEVKLDQFRKTDYPGTDTPMSFESTIHVEGLPEPIVIMMNEPLQHQGNILYQSSYEMGPDMPTASIFSVNHDPGRTVKYLGAVILILGIAIFTIMRSKWWTGRSRRHLAAHVPLMALLVLGLGLAAAPDARAEAQKNFTAFEPEAARQEFVMFAKKINVDDLARLPVHGRGRVKPLDSLARELLVFITGKSSFWGLEPTQLVLGLAASPAAPYLALVNVRDPELRVKLGFQRTDREVSFTRIQASPLAELARPLAAKQEENEKSVTPDEKKVLEAYNQTMTLRAVLSGELLRQSVVLDVSGGAEHAQSAQLVAAKMAGYFSALENEDFNAATAIGGELLSVSRAQPMPAMFRASIDKMGVEVLYNRLHLFLIAGVLYLLLGLVLVSGVLKKKPSRGVLLGLVAIPAAVHIAGFAIRVYVTGFAPVTSMYGTMVWMALGVVVFGTLLFVLYAESLIYGLLLVGASATLILTESLPLVLSPDMDPIVAVLRNNFWLTIHVLTVSISYAAFTISMLIGNASLVLSLMGRVELDRLKRLAHLAYRSIQLGVFLLTAGIILGGWWADYSWGRFWGWDPKETWALIADLGYLAILHAKFVGWLDAAGVLAAAPMAYLLVIMAWYGVNFILAAGLHSYGFSSGGATFVATFVGLQLALLAAVLLTRSVKRRRRA